MGEGDIQYKKTRGWKWTGYEAAGAGVAARLEAWVNGLEAIRLTPSATGVDVRLLGDTPATNYILFDASVPSLILAGSTTLSVAGAVASASKIASSSASSGVGYAAGAGGTVGQQTNKATDVALNKVTGVITMHNANLATMTSVGFTVTNTTVAATDVVIASIASGATAASYTLTVDAVAAGSFNLSLRNETGGTLGEAVVINFAVIKGVSA